MGYNSNDKTRGNNGGNGGFGLSKNKLLTFKGSDCFNPMDNNRFEGIDKKITEEDQHTTHNDI